MIEAVIFDMDGLLIDSEPLWVKAEIEVFQKLGVPLTQEMTRQTMGLRVDEVVEHWFKRHPWKNPDHKTTAEEIDAKVVQLIAEEGRSLPGVEHAISLCKSLDLPIAIASSSSQTLINATTTKLGIANDIAVICSAHDEPYGKPHPSVYMTTAQKLGAHPTHCLAIEDSANGVLAAKAARMKCIAVPEPGMESNKLFAIADAILPTLESLNKELINTIY